MVAFQFVATILLIATLRWRWQACSGDDRKDKSGKERGRRVTRHWVRRSFCH